jgi:ABC-type uncharacterized transport system substrate-binding protein
MKSRGRRRFVITISAAVLIPRVALAQSKVPTIGLLWNDSQKPSPHYVTLLRALREKGYIAGQTIKIEDHISLEGYGQYADSASALVRSKVDVIVTEGSTATLAAARATKNIPIVMVAGLDPVASGLAVSLARPARNVTGVYFLTEDLVTKRVQLLKELIPGLKRIGILYNPEGGRADAWRRATEAAARSLNLQFQVSEFRKLPDLEAAFAALVAARADALVPVPSSFLSSHPQSVTTLAVRHRMPGIYSSPRYTDAGGLLSYHADIQGGVERAAEYVDRILKGALAGDLAIQQSTKVELVVNLKTAKAMGLTVPPSFLLRADRVIE